MADAILTADRLRDVVHYDQDTGIFTWKKKLAVRVKVGEVAGGKTSAGYINISIDGIATMAHRLAWLYVYGSHPEGDVDHINGNKEDNRIENLRAVKRSVNMQNTRKARSHNSSSGLLGVSYSESKTSPWRASIRLNGKTKYIGVYATKEEAHAAYLRVKREHHEGCTI